jgi:hypothetical protein
LRLSKEKAWGKIPHEKQENGRKDENYRYLLEKKLGKNSPRVEATIQIFFAC